jgi:hypothetical protein
MISEFLCCLVSGCRDQQRIIRATTLGLKQKLKLAQDKERSDQPFSLIGTRI